MFLGYFLIYIATPHKTEWFLKTTLYRLFLQLWPSFLFIFFLIVRSPKETSKEQLNEKPGKFF